MWQNPKTASGVAVSFEDNHPVVNVNWDDAKAFCAWLSKKEGRSYRLPTDHEWSFAVGIGADELPGSTPSGLNQKIKNVYPWGNVWPPPNKAGNYADIFALAKFPKHGVIDGYTDGYGTTAPVMSFPANTLGIYDLGGNVLEWCEDWYNAKQDTRVMRGGAWLGYGNNFLQSACRYPFAPDKRYAEFGFRCVLVTSASSAAATSVVPSPTTPPVSKTEPVTTSTNATTSAPFTNSLGMKFVPVPGTKVLFCIHETRNKDYAVYSAEISAMHKPYEGRGVDHPVMLVNWEDAQAFCAWLSKKEGMIYRLPTDNEWNNAVGIGQKFPWGDEYPPKTEDKAENYADTAMKERYPTANIIEGYTDGFAFSSPVMSLKPNKLGIYDLGGNVHEWCEERFSRGAAYNNFSRGDLLSSRKWNLPPTDRAAPYGFRCVLEPSPGGTAALPTVVPPSPASMPVKPEVMTPGLSSGESPDERMLRNQVRQLLSSPWTAKKRRDLLQGEAADHFDLILSEIALGNASSELPTRNMLVEMITQRADERSKTGILRAFEHYHALFPVIAQKNWVREAGAATAKAISHYSTLNISTPLAADEGGAFMAFCFQFEEAAVWTELERLFGKPKFAAVFPVALKGLPAGLREHQEKRLERVVEAMWGATGKIDLSNLPGHIIDTAAAAARFGKLAALEALGMFLAVGSPQIKEHHQAALQKVAADPVAELTDCPAALPSAEKGRWIIEHLPSLQWDRQKRRFVSGTGGNLLKSPSASQTPATQLPSPSPSTATTSAPPTTNVPFTNSLGMKFVPVLGTGVLFCIHETRRQDYAAYAAKAGVNLAWKNSTFSGSPVGHDPNHPVVSVSWEDAQRFYAWLSTKEKRPYRLPTDEEWSIAVGLGERHDKNITPQMLNDKATTEFPWGGDYPPKTEDKAGNYADNVFHEKTSNSSFLADYTDGFVTTAPVMSFKPNKFGLYDMGGNVWEWCADWWNAEKKDRVVRGSSWFNYQRGYLLSSKRDYIAPTTRHGSYGFRCVLVVSGG